jgi:hypothetical protein
MTQYAEGELRFECDWGLCMAAFASRDDLDRHERQDHFEVLPDPDGGNELPIPAEFFGTSR